MSQIVTARYVADGSAVYLPFGFVPDFLMLADIPHTSTDTNIDIYYFWKLMEEEGLTDQQDGFKVNEGVTDILASGSGISTYDTSANAPTISAWSASSTPTARTATTVGTYIHPTIGNTQGFDVNAVFECITAGTGGATEPTWSKNPGGQVTDGTNVWERVDGDAIVTRSGYKGVAVDVALVDSHEVYTLAIQADRNPSWGDIVRWPSGVCDEV
jgi:hypothetical protein